MPTATAPAKRNNKPKYATREEWLNAASLALLADHEEIFTEAFGPDGIKHLGKLKVSAGFPSQRAVSPTKRAIGECWKSSTSKGGFHHIFISPLLVAPVEVLATLAHEMIHAADDGAHGHKGPFVHTARAMDLQGKATATHAGEEFAPYAKKLARTLGAYPHDVLTPTLKIKTQSTYMLKFECPKSGYIVRTTARWADELGAPECPCHHKSMKQEVK